MLDTQERCLNRIGTFPAGLQEQLRAMLPRIAAEVAKKESDYGEMLSREIDFLIIENALGEKERLDYYTAIISDIASRIDKLPLEQAAAIRVVDVILRLTFPNQFGKD